MLRWHVFGGKGEVMRTKIIVLSTSLITTPALADEIKLKPMMDARIRYEHVDQTGIAKDADAITLRLRPGIELSTGPFAALVEPEATLAIDPDYNSTTNGKTTYPVVADPQTVELNRAQIQYRSKPLTLTVGRQRINLDDQRFVGGVAWRQNEQTFDAVRAEITPVKNLKLDLTYAIDVRTIYGVDGGKRDPSKPTRIDGDNLFANVSYKAKIGTLTGFAYLIESDESNLTLRKNVNSQTYGGRFAGAMPLSKKVKLSYMASYAHQSGYSHNPVSYDADYGAGELGLTYGKWTVTGGYEQLGADGKAGFAFQTPLATLHKFNGWADKFLVTPADGLQDYYGGITYALPKLGTMGPLAISFVYHHFDSARLVRSYGDEYNAQISLKVTKRTTALLKFADYQADHLLTDTKKLWAGVDYSF